MIIKIVCAGENHFPSLYKKEKDEFIIAVDGGLECLAKNKIVSDIAIGDFDSCVLDDYKDYYKEIITFNSRKDESDLELAIRYATKIKNEKIIIYNATGKRLDHFYASILLLSNYSEYNIEIVDEYNKITVINKSKEFNKTTYKYISFFALEAGVNISLEGFSYEINNYHLQVNDPLCLSNEIKTTGKVTINNKKVLVIEAN